MWRPDEPRPGDVRRASGSGAPRPGSAASSATRSTSATSPRPTTTIYEKSVAALRNTMEVACAIGADGVVFHVGSHLGAGFEAGLERVVPGARAGARAAATDETWLLMENSAGAGGTIGRSIEELRDALRAARPPSAPRRLPRLVPPLRLRRRRHRPGRARRVPRRGRRDDRARPAARAARERLGGARSARTATGTRTSARALLGERLGVFLGNPRLPGPAGRARDGRPRQPRPGRERDPQGEGDPRHAPLGDRWTLRATRQGSDRGRDLRRPCPSARFGSAGEPPRHLRTVRALTPDMYGRAVFRALTAGSCSRPGRSRRRASPSRPSGCPRSGPRCARITGSR